MIDDVAASSFGLGGFSELPGTSSRMYSARLQCSPSTCTPFASCLLPSVLDHEQLADAELSQASEVAPVEVALQLGQVVAPVLRGALEVWSGAA